MSVPSLSWQILVVKLNKLSSQKLASQRRRKDGIFFSVLRRELDSTNRSLSGLCRGRAAHARRRETYRADSSRRGGGSGRARVERGARVPERPSRRPGYSLRSATPPPPTERQTERVSRHASKTSATPAAATAATDATAALRLTSLVATAAAAAAAPAVRCDADCSGFACESASWHEKTGTGAHLLPVHVLKQRRKDRDRLGEQLAQEFPLRFRQQRLFRFCIGLLLRLLR